MHELWSKIVYTSGARIYAYTIGFVVLSVTAQWLGPEGRGVIAALTTWVVLFATFSDLSLGQVALHHATKAQGQSWLKPVFGSLIWICGAITILGWIIALGLYWTTDGAAYDNLTPVFLMIGFLGLPAYIWERYGSTLLMALDRVSIYNKAQVIGRSVSLVLIGVGWYQQWGITSVLLALSISQIVIASVGFPYLYRASERSIRPDFSTIKTLFAGGFKLHWNTIGAFMIMSTDVLLINHYRGLEETGYYQTATQIVSIILIIPNAASMILFSKVSQLGPDGSWSQYRHVVFWLTIAIVVICVLAALLAPLVIPLVLGVRFEPAVPVFQILLFALLGMSLSVVMAAQWIGRGWFWQTSALTFAVGIGNLVAGLILIPEYGMYGAVWSTIATYMISLFVHGGVAVWCDRRYRKTLIEAIA